MGALGSPLGVAGLVIPYDRHRDGQRVGLLRTGMGWLVVLGSSRECFVHALARRDSPVALNPRGTSARRVHALDFAAFDPDLFTQLDRHVYRSLRCADECPCVRRRSRAGRFHSRAPCPVDRGRIDTLCTAFRADPSRHEFRLGKSRGGAGPE